MEGRYEKFLKLLSPGKNGVAGENFRCAIEIFFEIGDIFVFVSQSSMPKCVKLLKRLDWLKENHHHHHHHHWATMQKLSCRRA